MDRHQVGTGVATSSSPRWRPVLMTAALIQILLIFINMVVTSPVVPPLIAMSALLAAGVFALGKWPRVGAATVLIVSLFQFLTTVSFRAEELVHPESFWDFWLGWATVLVTGLSVVAAVPVWRRKDDGSSRARALALAVGSSIVALGIVGGVATAAYESDTAQPGDVALAAHNLEFEPARLSAAGRDIAVFVENEDPFRHTFSIDALDVDLELPGGKAARVEFTAEPGTYEIYCAVPGHEDMKGELVVRQ